VGQAAKLGLGGVGTEGGLQALQGAAKEAGVCCPTVSVRAVCRAREPNSAKSPLEGSLDNSDRTRSATWAMNWRDEVVGWTVMSNLERSSTKFWPRAAQAIRVRSQKL
jgi:hypothetical protein